MTLYEQLQKFIPVNDQEKQDQELLLAWLDSGVDIYTRKNTVAHLTASSWVMNPERTHVLMAYHNLYQSWAWLGGHADGERDLLQVALKEAREESGIVNVRPVGTMPISVEVLTVDGHEKKGEYVSSHLHLNVTYLLEAEMEQVLRPKTDENSNVAWIAVEDIGKKSTEPWFVERIYGKICKKIHGQQTRMGVEPV